MGILLVLCSPKISLNCLLQYVVAYVLFLFFVYVRRGDQYWDLLAFYLVDVTLIPIPLKKKKSFVNLL